MRSNKAVHTSSGGGVGILTALQIIFIVLKLVNVISWSWWIVFIPTYIGVGLVGIGLTCLFVAVMAQIIIDRLDN